MLSFYGLHLTPTCTESLTSRRLEAMTWMAGRPFGVSELRCIRVVINGDVRGLQASGPALAAGGIETCTHVKQD
jgi:hypothetical protein